MKDYKPKVIFWDFDGVLMDSNSVRDKGFVKVLSKFPENEISELLKFHRYNGGLSRYVKFRYFFENIRKEIVTEELIQQYAKNFSDIMMDNLVDTNLLIKETLCFVKNNHQEYQMHIVSGSDGNELRFLCRKLTIDQYFLSIHGSPTPKKELITDLMKKHNYNKEECLMIGDSVNDWEAAEFNAIRFKAFGNSDLNYRTNVDFDIY